MSTTLSSPLNTVFADPGYTPAELSQRLRRAEQIVASLEKGVAILSPEGTIRFANQTFEQWCPVDPIDKPFPEALGSFRLLDVDQVPIADILQGQTRSLKLLHAETHYLEVNLSPVLDGDQVVELIVLCSDRTAAVERQQKLDALHRAGQELAALDADQLTEMTVESRVELLKQNLRRHIHDLLQYDVIEIRLLDAKSQLLVPLLEEGMSTEAANRVLYASITGNGVTGYVAHTGKSYLCRDTAQDPHFIEGLPGARSSMTIPLIFQDEVIGTFNVESPKVGAFSNEDLQFAELFSREIASALHTLNLLTAQQTCTTWQAIEAVNREIAIPADELLSLASQLLSKLGTTDPSDVSDALQRILADMRLIKERIQMVGDDFARLTPAPQAPQLLRGKRVLVIDCDERIRRSAHTLLEKQGAQVETVATATEGIALAAAGQYEAILVAVRHPDLGGTATFKQLKALQPSSRVILTQGFEYDGGHTVVNARQEGYWLPVLFKQPFQENQVLTALTCTPPGETAAVQA